MLFDGLPYEIMYPMGRIAEMIPYAVIGLGLAYYKVYDSCWNTVTKVGCMLLGMCSLELVLRHLELNDLGFGYSGVTLMFASIIIFTIFYWLPLSKLSGKILTLIQYISSHTLGIYCMHMMIGRGMVKIFKYLGWEILTFAMCVTIYLLCFFLADIIVKLPITWSRKVVD